VGGGILSEQGKKQQFKLEENGENPPRCNNRGKEKNVGEKKTGGENLTVQAQGAWKRQRQLRRKIKKIARGSELGK